MLKNFPVGTTDFTSVTPFSSVWPQFLVINSKDYDACDDIPQFTASTPSDGERAVLIGSVYRAVQSSVP